MPATFAIIGFDASGKGSLISGPETHYKDHVKQWTDIRMGAPVAAVRVEKWSSDGGKLAEFYPKNQIATKKTKPKSDND